MTTIEHTTENFTDLERVAEFAGKLALDHSAAHNSVLVYLGDRLGLWRALAAAPAVTSDELAARAGLAPRYVQEWLSAQVAAGYVIYEPSSRTFTLPAEHAAVLAEEDSPAALVAAYSITAAMWASVDRLAHSYVTGDGVGWHEQDPRLFDAFARFVRPLYRSSLVSQWLPSVEGLVERLESGIRVLDVGCGLGVTTVLMAQAFPNSTFVGVDYHAESIRRAAAAAQDAGVTDRVAFAVQDAESYESTYDLICMFDTLHDLGNPRGALEHARGALSPGGVFLAVEPLAGDHLEDNVNPLGVTWYAGSASLCVPNGLTHGDNPLGGQAGPARTIEVFHEAGFGLARKTTETAFNFVIEARAAR